MVPDPIHIDSDLESDQSSVDPRDIQSRTYTDTSLLIPDPEMIEAPGLQHDSRTKKKTRPDPQHALPPTVNTTSAKGKAREELPSTINSESANGRAREDAPVTPTQLEQGDWLGLTDHILQELKERLGPSGGDLPGETKKILCEVLSSILLRLYREYSLEKLFARQNSGTKDAVKDAIEQDSDDLKVLSFEAVAAFAKRHDCLPIETVRGNRAPSTQSGKQFFDWIWGTRDIGAGHSQMMSRKVWDTAPFRQQYHRIRHELDIPGPAQEMRQELEDTLKYRFFQSQTVFTYPDPTNGTFGSTTKSSQTGKIARRVWYHQTRLPNEAISREDLEGVKRCNDNPIEYKERWTPKRLPESVQSWELAISQCREHQLNFTTQ